MPHDVRAELKEPSLTPLGCLLFGCSTLELSHHAVRCLNPSHRPSQAHTNNQHQLIALCMFHFGLYPKSSLKMTTAQIIFDYNCF